MPFTIPNEDEAAYPELAGVYQNDFDALVAAHSGVAVLAGCVVTAQGTPNGTAAVAAGTIVSGGAMVAVAANPSLAVTNGHATLKRIDLVVASAAGALSVVTGTAAAGTEADLLEPPATPAGSILLAFIYRPPASTTVTSDMILDKRVIVAAAVPSRVDTLATSESIAEPFNHRLLYNTFVATRSVVDITLTLSVGVLGPSHITMFLYAGAPTSGRLRGTGTYWPALAGVQRERIGAVGGEGQHVIRTSMRLTGLTPGTTYAYEVTAGITGGYDAVTGGLIDPGVPCILPDESKIYVPEYSNSRVQSIEFPSRQYSGYLGTPNEFADAARSLITTGLNPILPAATPNSAKVAVPCYGSNLLTIIDTATDVPDGDVTGIPNPFGVIFISDTLGWVTASDGKIYTFNPTTRAVGTSYQIATGTLDLYHLTRDAAGTFAYTWGEGGNFYKVQISDGTVADTFVSASTGLTNIVVDAGGFLYVGDDTGNVYILTVSNMEYFGQLAKPTAGAGAVRSIALDGTRRVLHASYSDGTWGYLNLDDSPGVPAWSWFDAPTLGAINPAQVVISPITHHIFIVEDAGATEANNKLHHWPGGIVHCRAAGDGQHAPDFFNEFCKVELEGVAP